MLTVRRLPPPPDSPAQVRFQATPGLLAYAPWAFVYGLRPTALAIVLLLSVGLWFGSLGPFGLFLFIGYLGGATHYLFAVLERSTHGYADPPNLDGADLLRFDLRAVKFFLVVVVALALDAGLERHLPVALWPWRGLAILLAPGVAVLLALEGDLGRALAPRNLLPFATRAGPGYLALAGLLAIVVFGREVVPDTRAPAQRLTELIADPARYSAFPWFVISQYLAVVTAHLLGVIAYRRRDQLGIEAMVEEADADAPAQARMVRHVNDLFARLDRLIDKEEHLEAERVALTERLDGFDPLGELELMFEEARRRKRNYLIIVTGQRYIEALLGARRAAQAAEVALHCLDRYPRFEPFRPAHSVELARAALDGGQHALFERLTADFDARHPAAPERIEIAFLRARQQAEHRQDDAAALAILAALPPHPDPAVRARIEAYRAALTRILTPRH